tara:strand:- start:108 stop:350 length:243 start_codon:yes stop_codon:yes gene_type:complete
MHSFNPLVDSFDKLTDAQVEAKSIELQKKYFMTSNSQVQFQIANILDMYRSEMQVRQARAYAKQNQDNGVNGLDNLINVR